MRIAFTSDLHVEYHLEVVGLLAEEAARIAPDALVLAGDVCQDLGRLERSLRLLTRALACPVIFLPGNHELWCGGVLAQGPDSRERYERLLPALALRAGALPLGQEPVQIGRLAFVGATGWYDGSLRTAQRPLDSPVGSGDSTPFESRGAGAAGRIRSVDHAQVNWPGPGGIPLGDRDLALLMLESLGDQLASVRDHSGPVVVVTHMLPHPGLAADLEGTHYAGTEPFLGSAAMWPVIVSNPRVEAVICGHLHLVRQAFLPGVAGTIRCELSPVGYPREIHGSLEDRVAERLRLIEID